MHEGREILELPDEAAMRLHFHSMRRRVFQEGFAPNLAMRFFYDKYGFLPEDSWCYGSTFGVSANAEDKYVYKKYLSKIAKRQGKTITWVISEFQKEFGSSGWQEIFFFLKSVSLAARWQRQYWQFGWSKS